MPITFMTYVYAFVFCGAICALGQIVLMKTKIGFLGLFTVVMGLGVILGIIGGVNNWFGWLTVHGVMGMIVTVMALCNQFFTGLSTWFTGSGAQPFLYFVVVLVCILVAGAICGALGKLPPAPAPTSEEKETH